jgi:hypothetical protein
MIENKWADCGLEEVKELEIPNDSNKFNKVKPAVDAFGEPLHKGEVVPEI